MAASIVYIFFTDNPLYILPMINEPIKVLWHDIEHTEVLYWIR